MVDQLLMHHTSTRLAFLCFCTLLVACSAGTPPKAQESFTARPEPLAQAGTKNGSLYQPTSYQSYFRDDLPSHVGDSLTVVIQEKTSTATSEETKGSRSASLDNGIDASISVPFFSPSPDKRTASDHLGISGKESADGKGTRSNASSFVSSISVTVVETLPNGNLRVSGEKQVRINDDDEFIRLTGIVHPRDILPGNLVASTRLTDVRLEQTTHGHNRLFAEPGWLTRFFMSVLPL
jgi:flagellar L-ring protein precursor FlgH